MRRFRSVVIAFLVVLAALVSPAFSQSISYNSFDTEVGSGLQTSYIRAQLSDSQHGGITVTIEVSDTNLALVTDDNLTPGSKSVDVFLPNGSSYAQFYVQAFEDTTGTIGVTASAPGFTAVTDSIDIVPAALRVLGLQTSHDPFDLDDAFYVSVGIANGSNTSLSATQDVRVGGPGLTATVTNSNASVGQLVTNAITGQVVSVTIAPGESNTPTTVAAGGVAFDGLSPGTTDIEVTIPNFGQLNDNPKTVTVTTPFIDVSSRFPVEIGAGLQENDRRAILSGSEHGGVAVHLEVSDSSLILLAAGRYDAGSGTLDVFVPNGSTFTPFYVQALEDTTGTAFVTATATGFGSDVGQVNVVQPAFRIVGLGTTIDTLDPNDTFYLLIGIPSSSGTSVNPVQNARGGGAGVTFTVFTSPETVGLIETQTTLDDSATVYIPPGVNNTPTSVAAGGTAFDGVGPGVATVSASAPGFGLVDQSSVDVNVTQPTVSFSNLPPVGVGSGLQWTSSQKAILSASQHGGVTVHVEVADTSLALVTADEDSVGGQSADIFIPDGLTQAQFYIQGKEDTTGTIHLTATAPGFATGTDSVDLVPPKIRFYGLPNNKDTLDPPDNFNVQVGVASTNTSNFYGQNVRAGSQGVAVTVSVDDSLIAEILGEDDTGPTVVDTIFALNNTSPGNFEDGGFAFNGLSPGVVDLTVSAPGFVPFSTATQTITVTAPTINLSGGVVGAGLQTATRTLTLSASNHGGVTVRIESLEPELLLVSEGPNTPGTPFIEVFVPDGSTGVQHYAHGVDDTTGYATLEASAPGFVTEVDSINIVQPGIEINGLVTSIDALDSPDNFYARVGLPSGTSTVNSAQRRRAGEPPLEVTFISSDSTVGEIVKTGEVNDTLTALIPAGETTTPSSLGSGGVAFDGLASGQTIVTASIPGFLTTGDGQRVVNVTNQNIFINGLATRLGKDLQSVAASAELGESSHGGTTVRIQVSDSTKAIVSANALLAGTRFVDVFLPNGDTEALFYLQGLDTGLVTVTATANTFNATMQDVDVVPAGIRIIELADSIDTTDPDDEFVVQVGGITADSSDIVTPQELRGGGPSRSIDVGSSDGSLAFIVLGNSLDQTVSLQLNPGQFESPLTVAQDGLALTPWQAGTVTVAASTPGFLTTAAGQPNVVITGLSTGVGDSPQPAVFALEQNVPNPFNPSTTINFSIPSAARVDLVVYDVTGRRVATLVQHDMPAGRASVTWQGLDDRGNRVASGVYFYRLVAGSKLQTRKMVLLK